MLRPDLRLVVADPDQLGSSEAGQGIVAGDLDEPLGADRVPDDLALSGRALVVPQDRRPEHGVGCVEQDGAVHLAGQANCGDRRPVNSGALERLADGQHGTVPPKLWILLRPTRARDLVAVLGDSDSGYRAVAVEQDRLCRRSRDVDAQNERH